MARRLCAVLMGAVLVTLASGARAASMPVIELHPDNVGIGSFMIDSFDAITNTIVINETWVSTDPGIYKVSNLEDKVTYTFQRNITNNSGTSWMDFEIELFDPAGQPQDEFDAVAPPDMCTTDCTPGGLDFFGRGDGLNMGVPGVVDPMSDVFLAFDYLTDPGPLQGKILEYSQGTVFNTTGVFIQHGLVDFNATQDPGPDGAIGLDSANQAFALFARIKTTELPEAAPLLMLALTFGSLLLGSRGGGGGPRPAI